MKKWTLLFLIACLSLVNCAKKPEPTPPPPPPPVAEPEPEPEPQGPTAAELLAQRVQELLNQLLSNKVYFDLDRAEIRSEAALGASASSSSFVKTSSSLFNGSETMSFWRETHQVSASSWSICQSAPLVQ